MGIIIMIGYRDWYYRVTGLDMFNLFIYTWVHFEVLRINELGK